MLGKDTKLINDLTEYLETLCEYRWLNNISYNVSYVYLSIYLFYVSRSIHPSLHVEGTGEPHPMVGSWRYTSRWTSEVLRTGKPKNTPEERISVLTIYWPVTTNWVGGRGVEKGLQPPWLSRVVWLMFQPRETLFGDKTPIGPGGSVE